MVAPVAIGVAGWSYADWRGVVYPRGCRDPLRYLAERVDFIEINSSFYRVPPRSMTEGWLDRVASLDTFFTAKLPKEITHHHKLEPATLMAVCDAFEPMADAGRLRALLAQFSFRFEAEASSFEHLERIAGAFGSIAPLALEVRHRSWREPAAQRRARELGFALVDLDYPGWTSGFSTPAERDQLGYLRLHGRNTAAWFDKQAGRDEVYHYVYSEGEVGGLERRIAELAASVQRAALVVANNHFRGGAVKVALELLAWTRGERVDVPPGLVDAFPELESIARGVQRGLF